MSICPANKLSSLLRHQILELWLPVTCQKVKCLSKITYERITFILRRLSYHGQVSVMGEQLSVYLLVYFLLGFRCIWWFTRQRSFISFVSCRRSQGILGTLRLCSHYNGYLFVRTWKVIQNSVNITEDITMATTPKTRCTLKSDFAFFGTSGRLSQLAHFDKYRRLNSSEFLRKIPKFKKGGRNSPSFVYDPDKTWNLVILRRSSALTAKKFTKKIVCCTFKIAVFSYLNL